MRRHSALWRHCGEKSLVSIRHFHLEVRSKLSFLLLSTQVAPASSSIASNHQSHHITPTSIICLLAQPLTCCALSFDTHLSRFFNPVTRRRRVSAHSHQRDTAHSRHRMAEDTPVQSTEASVETEEQSTRPADDKPAAAQDSTEPATSGANGVAAAEDTEGEQRVAASIKSSSLLTSLSFSRRIRRPRR